MNMLHLKSRCTETETEQFLLDLAVLCFSYVIDFWQSEGAERSKGGEGGAPPFPLHMSTRKTLTQYL